MESEITEFSAYGSCSSRNIFNSAINRNYKKFFKINYSVEATSLISLMSKPIPYDDNLINSDRNFDNKCVIENLSKNYLNFIKKDEIDYIVMDTLFEALSGVIEYDEDSYLTGTHHVKNTDFYNLISDKKRITIHENFDEYYNLWTDACDRFFEVVENNCSRTKIILNCSRTVFKYYDLQHNVSINKKFKELANKYNPIRNILDKYILENFDVEVLPFDPNTYADQNHFFGLAPTHFETRYYSEKNKQLLKIIARNNKLGFDNEKNEEIRKTKRENVINSFASQNLFDENSKAILKEKKEHIKDSIENSLKTYNTARIDIKNYGEKSSNPNNVRILNISDEKAKYYYPNWFKSSEGKGMMIFSQSNFLQFDVECIGDGELIIRLRGPDMRLDGKRIPVYIKYTEFSVNDEKIFDSDKAFCHDKPFVYKVKVHDKQLISIYLQWLPFS